MNVATNAASTRGLTIWTRYGLVAAAWLFSIGGVVQFFLAGLAVFDTPLRWSDHTDFGHMIGLLTYLMPFLALAGRVGATMVAHAFIMAGLFILQIGLAQADEGSIAAFHAVNALVLMTLSGMLGTRLIQRGGPTEPTAARIGVLVGLFAALIGSLSYGWLYGWAVIRVPMMAAAGWFGGSRTRAIV